MIVWKYIDDVRCFCFCMIFSDFRRTPDTPRHEMQTEGAKNGACCLRQSASPCALQFHVHGWQDSWRIGAYHQTTLDQESIADGCVNSSLDPIWWPIFQIYSNPLEISRQDLALFWVFSSPSSWHIQDHPSAASLWIGLFAPQISADSSWLKPHWFVQVGSAWVRSKIMQNSVHQPRKPCYGSAPFRRSPWRGLWKIEIGLVHLCPSLCYLCHPNPQTGPIEKINQKKNTGPNKIKRKSCRIPFWGWESGRLESSKIVLPKTQNHYPTSRWESVSRIASDMTCRNTVLLLAVVDAKDSVNPRGRPPPGLSSNMRRVGWSAKSSREGKPRKLFPINAATKHV